MAHIFNYAILQAVPDARRGERVNIGVAVFHKTKIDVRLSDLSKIRALTGESWDAYAAAAKSRLEKIFVPDTPAETLMSEFTVLERMIEPTELGWFTFAHEGDYESRLQEILTSLVIRPRKPRKEVSVRINTEIAREFKRVDALADPSEGIDRHKIVRDFYISESEELKADFALKNGIYHIATTLDLRRTNIGVEQAALKSLVLDKAGKIYSGEIRKIGIYAPGVEAARFKPHLEILKDYADVTYDWSKHEDRRAFTQSMYSAMYPSQ